MLSYEALIHRLYQLNCSKAMKLGLDTCYHLHAQLGFPTKKYKVIHVAGTNGKGSVCTKIAASLQAAGYRVGLFTSPHIATFRERIRVNDLVIAKEEVQELLTLLFSMDSSATFFEITTLMAMKYFADKNVDYAVFETGLGGRLDATNIVVPEVSVITSIALDHQQFLGNTIELIANEKAGIIKANTPVVIGPSVPLKVVVKKAAELNSTIHQVNDGYFNYDEENRAVASKVLTILSIEEKYVNEGLSKHPPCRQEVIRSQRHGVAFILDVAHNPDGLACCFKKIKQDYPHRKIHALVGFSIGKDVASCVDVLYSYCDGIFFIKGDNPRSLPLFEIEKTVGNGPKYRFYHSVEEALKELAIVCKQENSVPLVCGSFFIMRQIRQLLGLIDLCDPCNLNEEILNK